jgi:hypothetical protein
MFAMWWSVHQPYMLKPYDRRAQMYWLVPQAMLISHTHKYHFYFHLDWACAFQGPKGKSRSVPVKSRSNTNRWIHFSAEKLAQKMQEMAGKQHVFSAVLKRLHSGRIRVSMVVLESSKTCKFNHAFFCHV